jgi:hypothetical protein
VVSAPADTEESSEPSQGSTKRVVDKKPPKSSDQRREDPFKDALDARRKTWAKLFEASRLINTAIENLTKMPVGKAKQPSAKVPSPINEFDQYLPRVTRDLDAITTPAAGLPLKSDLAFHRTLDRELAMNLDEASERVLKLTRELLDVFINQDGMSKGIKSSVLRRRLEDEEDVTEGYRRGVVDVVDGLLEDAVSHDHMLGLLR